MPTLLSDNLPKAKGESLQIATFSPGCFWCARAIFKNIDGVVYVSTGYEKQPFCKQVSPGKTIQSETGSPKEVLRVLYDPRKISHMELLDIFWASHNPASDNKYIRQLERGDKAKLGLLFRYKREEAARIKAETRFKSVTSSEPDAIIQTDSDGMIIFSNNSAEYIFGYRSDELLGEPLTILMPEKYRKRHVQGIRKYLETGESNIIGKVVELEGLKKNGTIFPIELSVNAFRLDDEICFTGSIHDITMRKKAMQTLVRQKEELERSNNELESFAYVASHDLKEPLRMVSAFTELLARKYDGSLDDEAKEYIGFAIEGVHRMEALINDLLDYSRIGKKNVHIDKVDLQDLMSTVTGNLMISIAETGAKIEYSNLPVVVGDRAQLCRLFQNLIANSLKFRSKKPPVITIEASEKANEWQFIIKDNGIGFKQEYAEKIFVIFQRLHERSRYPGTGIGLAISKKIVEFHKGHIRAESRPGEGSAFYFSISKNLLADVENT